jgi:hypothetical protein
MFDHTGEMIATQSAQRSTRINVVRELDEGTHDVAHAHVATLKEEMLTIVRTAREMIEQRKSEANRDEIRQELFDLLCNVQLTRRALKELARELRGSEEALQQIQVLYTTEFIIELLPIFNLMHLISGTFALVRASRLRPPPGADLVACLMCMCVCACVFACLTAFNPCTPTPTPTPIQLPALPTRLLT